MKAITVKYLGPTNTCGSRLKATADGWGSATVSYDHGHPMPQLLAVKALIDKVNSDIENKGLSYRVCMPDVWGGLPNGDYVFCYSSSTIPEHDAWKVA